MKIYRRRRNTKTTITVSTTIALQEAFNNITIQAEKIGRLVNISLEGELKENLISNWYNLSNIADLPPVIGSSYTSVLNNFSSTDTNPDINAILYMTSEVEHVNPRRLIMRLNKYNPMFRNVVCNLLYMTA